MEVGLDMAKITVRTALLKDDVLGGVNNVSKLVTNDLNAAAMEKDIPQRLPVAAAPIREIEKILCVP